MNKDPEEITPKTEETKPTESAATQETAQATAKVPSLTHNYISFIGMAIASAALICIVLLFLLEVTSSEENPYLGLLTFMLLPGVLVFGLFIVLVGVLY